MIKIIKLEQITYACPTQWEGITDDNRLVYIRYRWGKLTVQVGEIGETLKETLQAPFIYSQQLGAEFDGEISLIEILNALENIVEV